MEKRALKEKNAEKLKNTLNKTPNISTSHRNH